MGTIVQWAETAVSLVLLFFAELYGKVFGISSGITWALAYMSLALAVAVILAYPRAANLRCNASCGSARRSSCKWRSHSRTTGQRGKLHARRSTNSLATTHGSKYSRPVSFAVFLALNAVIDGISTNEPAGVFAWSQNADLMADAHDASIFGVPFYGTFLQASATPNPTATRIPHRRTSPP